MEETVSGRQLLRALHQCSRVLVATLDHGSDMEFRVLAASETPNCSAVHRSNSRFSPAVACDAW